VYRTRLIKIPRQALARQQARNARLDDALALAWAIACDEKSWRARLHMIIGREIPEAFFGRAVDKRITRKHTGSQALDTRQERFAGAPVGVWIGVIQRARDRFGARRAYAVLRQRLGVG
jgi:hypothetical protein